MAAPEGDSPTRTEGKPKGKKQKKRVKWGKDQVKEFDSNNEYQPVEVPATDELLAYTKSAWPKLIRLSRWVSAAIPSLC